MDILKEAREKFSQLVRENQLNKASISVKVEPLSTREAIGKPKIEGLALIEGKEVLVEAEFQGSFGQAFTDRPESFEGTIEEVLNLNLETKSERAIFIATLNALTNYLGIAKNTRHCKDEDLGLCGRLIATMLSQRYGKIKIGLLGLQPAILQGLSEKFGHEWVRCTDLNPKNIGTQRFGVEIWDGKTETEKIIEWSDLLLVTGSAIVNNTLNEIQKSAQSLSKPVIVFGVTIAGPAALLGLERLCPFGR